MNTLKLNYLQSMIPSTYMQVPEEVSFLRRKNIASNKKISLDRHWVYNSTYIAKLTWQPLYSEYFTDNRNRTNEDTQYESQRPVSSHEELQEVTSKNTSENYSGSTYSNSQELQQALFDSGIMCFHDMLSVLEER